MMTPKTRKFIDEYIARSVQLNRAFEGESMKYARMVQELHDKVIQKIEKKYGTINMTDLRRLTRTLTKEIISAYSVDVKPSVNDLVMTLVKKEVKWTQDNIQYNVQEVPGVVYINPTSVAKKARKIKYQGYTFDQWFDGLGKGSARKVSAVLMDAYATGKTTQETVDLVSQILNKPKSDVKTLVRSYLQSAAQESRNEVFSTYDDVAEGYYWVSTLDGRTTIECAARDMLEYDKDHNPVGHDLPWGDGPGRLHFNCRSTFVLKLPGVDANFRRPSVGAGDDYDRGDMWTKTGKPRKPTKANVEKGILKPAQVMGGTDYESFLRRQPKAFVADVLGSNEKATEFLSGRARLRTFLPSANPTTVSKL